MIMSWLLNSIQPEIGKPFLFLSTAKDIWDAVVKTYSKKGNATCIFELKRAIHETKQRGLDVLSYFNKLKILWKELDVHQHWEIESQSNATKLAEILERERIFEFLAGLRPEYDEAGQACSSRSAQGFLHNTR